MLKPEKIMAEFGRRYPGCWKQLENFALARGQDGLPNWPEWCYVPVTGSYAVVSGGGSNRPSSPQQMLDLALLHVLGAWRLTQGVYRFVDILPTLKEGDSPKWGSVIDRSFPKVPASQTEAIFHLHRLTRHALPPERIVAKTV